MARASVDEHFTVDEAGTRIDGRCEGGVDVVWPIDKENGGLRFNIREFAGVFASTIHPPGRAPVDIRDLWWSAESTPRLV